VQYVALSKQFGIGFTLINEVKIVVYEEQITEVLKKRRDKGTIVKRLRCSEGIRCLCTEHKLGTPLRQGNVFYKQTQCTTVIWLAISDG
jgi:hypothetical protein